MNSTTLYESQYEVFLNNQQKHFGYEQQLTEKQQQCLFRSDSPLPYDVSLALADDDEILSITECQGNFSDGDGEYASLQGSPYMSSSPIMMSDSAEQFVFPDHNAMMGNNMSLLNDDLSEAQVMSLVSGIESFVSQVCPPENGASMPAMTDPQNTSAQSKPSQTIIHTFTSFPQEPQNPLPVIDKRSVSTPSPTNVNMKEKKPNSKKPQRISEMTPSPKIKRSTKTRSNSQYQELTTATILPAHFFTHRRASKSSNSSWRPFIESMVSNNNGAPLLPILPTRSSKSNGNSQSGKKSSNRRSTTPSNSGSRSSSPFEGETGMMMNPYIGTAFSLPPNSAAIDIPIHNNFNGRFPIVNNNNNTAATAGYHTCM